MAEKHGKTAKVAIMRRRDGVVKILLLEHKARENTARQKNGRVYKEKPRWGFPGGQVEAGETLIQAIIRESEQEAGLNLTKEMFSKGWVINGQILKSQRDDGSETHQDNYFMIEVASTFEIGEISPDNEEIIRGEWFEPRDIPTPDDEVPFTRKQLRGLADLFRLESVQYFVEESREILRTIEKRFYKFLY